VFFCVLYCEGCSRIVVATLDIDITPEHRRLIDVFDRCVKIVDGFRDHWCPCFRPCGGGQHCRQRCLLRHSALDLDRSRVNRDKWACRAVVTLLATGGALAFLLLIGVQRVKKEALGKGCDFASPAIVSHLTTERTLGLLAAAVCLLCGSHCVYLCICVFVYLCICVFANVFV